MKILDEFIAEIKKHKQIVLAKKSGVPQSQISKWKRGINIPTLVNAQKVADAMGLEFLLFDKE